MTFLQSIFLSDPYAVSLYYLHIIPCLVMRENGRAKRCQELIRRMTKRLLHF